MYMCDCLWHGWWLKLQELYKAQLSGILCCPVFCYYLLHIAFGKFGWCCLVDLWFISNIPVQFWLLKINGLNWKILSVTTGLALFKGLKSNILRWPRSHHQGYEHKVINNEVLPKYYHTEVLFIFLVSCFICVTDLVNFM